VAVAGWCRQCGQYVWLNEQWGCVNGHAWNELSAWYDPETGQPVTPYWLQAEAAPETAPAPAPAPEPAPASAPAAAPEAAPPQGSRLALLAGILEAFSAYPNYQAHYGTDSDIVIDNAIAAASWGVGKKTVEYSAVMKAVEADKTLYFWEMVKEKGAGMSFGGFESESYSTSGTKRSGQVKERIVGPDGVAMEYEWDYGQTRAVVESVAAAHGWKVKTVLRKKAAQW